MAIYKATPGAGFTDRQAQIIGSELEKLGEFTPGDVVNRAIREHSPLHQFFTWDDEKAGQAWRLQEARNLVNHIAVMINVDGDKRETKAFYSVPVRIQETNTVEPRYVRITHAIHNEAIQRSILDDMLAEIRSFTKKYEQFKDIIGAELFQVIGETKKKLEDDAQKHAMLQKIKQQQVPVA